MQNKLLQEITVSGFVSAGFNYFPNTSMFRKDETFPAFVSNIDKRNQLIYVQPECLMKYMETLTDQLE